MKRSLRSSAPHGLTLIELVVVLAILVGLAGMIVPRLDFLKNQADHAAGAATSADLATMLQTQKTSTGVYPTLDLLIDESGAAIPAGVVGPSSAFTAATLSTSAGERWYGSLLEGGLKFGYEHLSTATDVSNSTGSSAAINLVNEAAAGNLTVAELTGGTYGASVIARCFPETGTVPAGVKLIGMGIGPRNTMVGNVMASTPLDAQGDDSKTTYCRYIAIFAVYSNGKPAQLKMVVDHRLKQIDKRIEQYTTTGPTG